uniref:ENT domain-containing protein n=2 Tax=Brassica oleracea var. oleracea TaxID=109376 RepID=A0A0D3BAW6_BRAOL
MATRLGTLHYVIDHIYGALMHRTRISPPFFSRGWGGPKLELLERMAKQLFPMYLEGHNCPPPPLVRPVWRTVWETKTARLREGVFQTPCDDELTAALPPESRTARVAWLVPKDVPPQKMSCVVHLAGTGDHTYDRRLRLGGPLVKQNIATMVLESPFYGRRRPFLQRGARLLCVSDLLLLGRATIEESRGLIHWLDVEEGFGKMGVCGLSMGGVHASMVGSLHPTPVATLPFLSPHSAVVAFCEGILKYGTAWEALREELAAQKITMTLDEVRERMRTVLSLTDVTRFPVPKNPEAVIFVAATDDGYIPKHSVLELQKAWPGSEVRWVRGGHVSSFILHNDEFRKAIVDGLDRVDWKESCLFVLVKLSFGWPQSCFTKLHSGMEAQIHQLEQEAYTAVLRAFKAQSDAISWDKESLITELRKELRVSDDEHRELLSRVNKDDTIQRIRDWRQGGGSQVTSRHAASQGFDVVPSPTFSASRKKQKTFPSYHPSIGPAGNRSFNSRVVSGGIAGDGSAEALIGRKVWTKWPEDNHFYEAIITQYNAVEGRHALVYDINAINETWEWVDLKEIPPEDIRWDGEESGVTLNAGLGSGSIRGNRINQSHFGRGRGPRIHQPRREFLPPPTHQNGGGDDIELFNTDLLVKEVERVFDATHPDPFELDKAKKMLKEHEQALMAAIARLADTSDGEIDGDPPYTHDHAMQQG